MKHEESSRHDESAQRRKKPGADAIGQVPADGSRQNHSQRLSGKQQARQAGRKIAALYQVEGDKKQACAYGEQYPPLPL